MFLYIFSLFFFHFLKSVLSLARCPWSLLAPWPLPLAPCPWTQDYVFPKNNSGPGVSCFRYLLSSRCHVLGSVGTLELMYDRLQVRANSVVCVLVQPVVVVQHARDSITWSTKFSSKSTLDISTSVTKAITEGVTEGITEGVTEGKGITEGVAREGIACDESDEGDESASITEVDGDESDEGDESASITEDESAHITEVAEIDEGA